MLCFFRFPLSAFSLDINSRSLQFLFLLLKSIRQQRRKVLFSRRHHRHSSALFSYFSHWIALKLMKIYFSYSTFFLTEKKLQPYTISWIKISPLALSWGKVPANCSRQHRSREVCERNTTEKCIVSLNASHKSHWCLHYVSRTIAFKSRVEWIMLLMSAVVAWDTLIHSIVW